MLSCMEPEALKAEHDKFMLKHTNVLAFNKMCVWKSNPQIKI